MRRALVLGVGGIIVLLAGCGGSSQPTPAGTQEGGGGGGVQDAAGGDGTGSGVETAQVTGYWLGPAPGDTGGCGTAYAEWLLKADGSYAVTDNSEDCGGFTASGSFEIEGSMLSFHQQGSTCGDCGVADYSVSISFPGPNALQMCDVPADGRCYTYSRESS